MLCATLSHYDTFVLSLVKHVATKRKFYRFLLHVYQSNMYPQIFFIKNITIVYTISLHMILNIPAFIRMIFFDSGRKLMLKHAIIVCLYYIYKMMIKRIWRMWMNEIFLTSMHWIKCNKQHLNYPNIYNIKLLI